MMKTIKKTGLVVFLMALALFTASTFPGKFEVTDEVLSNTLNAQQAMNLSGQMQNEIVGKTYTHPGTLSADIVRIYNETNNQLKAEGQWDKVMWDKPHAFAFDVVKASAKGLFVESPWLLFALTFGLGIAGALMYIIPDVILLGPPGIKNNHIFQNAATNRGWIGAIAFFYLITFYVLLYFYPGYLVNQVLIVSPLSELISGNPAGRWFLYGLLYSVVMGVMGIKMYIKYRHSMYHIIRTSSVVFFQIAVAFLIPEIMVRFNMPYMDLKNAWPLNYSFFFEWNLDTLISGGKIGLFMLGWGIALSVVAVPVLAYFFGKRWYCSWVCGCGGLAETLGDPYRHLSDKTLKAWQIERYIVHGALVFVTIMTFATLYTYFTGVTTVAGIASGDVQHVYGFLMGSLFAGAIGTGFYPIMGNRIWCRFGCPLAAYLGIVQRFKSRFRITTNGGQCISCGNCSTYCEQGIDVRWYAQRGQNIIRASCVGCGICAAVCPRGVLKLENGPEKGRINDNPILIGNSDVQLNPNTRN